MTWYNLKRNLCAILLNLVSNICYCSALMYLVPGLVGRLATNSVIYTLTSKCVFIFFSVCGGCGGKIETVHSYDLDGIHQTTLT